MRIRELIKPLGPSALSQVKGNFDITGLTSDSRVVRKGYLFVAVKGAQEDGREYISEAIRRGATAILTSGKISRSQDTGIPFIKVADDREALAVLAARYFGNPSRKVNVVGVTGTNGKTTITYLIEAILKKARRKSGVIGTINYRYAGKVLPAKNTTPGPVEIQSLLEDMFVSGVRFAALEASSHALSQERTGGIDFHSAIFTNLTQDHLDYHKTMEQYFRSKARLFTGLRQNRFAVINTDDPYGRRLARITSAKVITYGIDRKAHVSARNILQTPEGTTFILRTPRKEEQYSMRLIGRHNVYNVLAVVAWSLRAGFDSQMVRRAVEGFFCVPGRLERVVGAKPFSVFVDYAHTDDALKNIITSLRCVGRQKVIVVFGCGGERDKGKRPKMGQVVSELADYAVITNDNPRSEDPLEIIAQIRKGIVRKNFCVIPERKEAIRAALRAASRDDIVLVAGKGHENYQIIKDRVIPFDDKEVVLECLKSMNC